MPILTNLSNRLMNDPSWRRSYIANLREAKNIADKIFLVHVSGNPGRVPFAQLISTPPYEIPTSERSYGYCSDQTRDAERVLGLGNCVYFYAGRAHPKFGKIALAFACECERRHTGSATPFDTGGLANRKIQANLPNDRPITLRKFTRDSSICLQRWRQIFAHFLAIYFSPLSAYWSGRPFMADPDELFTRNTDWRARVFEVRFHQGQEILEAAFWCASRGQKQLLDREAKTHPPVGAVASPLERLLNEIPSVEPRGTPYYCEALENEVRKRVGL